MSETLTLDLPGGVDIDTLKQPWPALVGAEQWGERRTLRNACETAASPAMLMHKG